MCGPLDLAGPLLALPLLLLLQGALPLEVADEDVAVLRVHALQVLLALLRVQTGQALLVQLHDVLLAPGGPRLPRALGRLHRRPPRLHAEHAGLRRRRRLGVQLRLPRHELLLLAGVAEQLLLTARQQHLLLRLLLLLGSQRALRVLPQLLLSMLLLRGDYLLLRGDNLLLRGDDALLRVLRHHLLLLRRGHPLLLLLLLLYQLLPLLRREDHLLLLRDQLLSLRRLSGRLGPRLGLLHRRPDLHQRQGRTVNNGN